MKLQKIAEEDGASVEVIDLRSLIPLDKEAILASVKKTGKVLIVHEDKVFAGFGGEMAAQITDEAFEYLDGPVKRVGSKFTPVGFNRILEKRPFCPNTEKILDAARGSAGILILKTHDSCEKDRHRIQFQYPENLQGCQKNYGCIRRTARREMVNVEEITAEKFLSFDNLICGTATWFDGELPNHWDEFVPDLEDMDLKGKTIALFRTG